MEQIGIVSRVHGINYGANLQALALQLIIQRLGANAEYINYEVVVPAGSYKKQILSWGYGIVRYFLGFHKRLLCTTSFRKSYLNLSPPLLDREALQSYCSRYDILMAGSDQIWNPRYYPLSSGLYLLSFINGGRKVSYASSFGVTVLPDNLQSIYKNELESFESVSVREYESVSLLEKIGVRNVQSHIDPTLLLIADEWKHYFKIEPIVKCPYICCYVMSGANELNRYILSKARELQKSLPVYHKIVVLGEKEYKGLCSRETFVRTAGPAEFLNYIFNARYVLTSSFHGTCFSVIFRKNFFTILSTNNKFNSRMESLLKLLSLDKRIYYQEKDRLLDTSICSFETAAKILEDERKKSLEYLKDCFNL